MTTSIDKIIKIGKNLGECLKSHSLEIINGVKDSVFILTSSQEKVNIESEGVKFLNSLDWLNISIEERLKIKKLHIDGSFISLMNNDFDYDNSIDDKDINNSILKFIDRKSNELFNSQKKLNVKEKNLLAYAYKQGFLNGREYELSQLFLNGREYELSQLFLNLDDFLKEYYIETFSADLMEFYR